MAELLRKPFGTHGKVHEITPQSAGWRYVGFSLYRLRPGDSGAETTGDSEVVLVIVEGKASATGGGKDWGSLGERMNVFEKTPPHCALPFRVSGRYSWHYGQSVGPGFCQDQGRRRRC